MWLCKVYTSPALDLSVNGLRFLHRPSLSMLCVCVSGSTTPHKSPREWRLVPSSKHTHTHPHPVSPREGGPKERKEGRKERETKSDYEKERERE